MHAAFVTIFPPPSFCKAVFPAPHCGLWFPPTRSLRLVEVHSFCAVYPYPLTPL